MSHKSAKVLALLCILQSITARPQQASPVPTLEATTQFLTTRLNDTVFVYRWDDIFPDGSRGEYRSTLTQTVSMNGCKGHIVIHLQSDHWDKRESEWRESQNDDFVNTTFQAKDLTPAFAKISPFEEHQTSTPVVYRLFVPGKQGVMVVVSDYQLAQRLLKAFTGLSRLCGATDEPY